MTKLQNKNVLADKIKISKSYRKHSLVRKWYFFILCFGLLINNYLSDLKWMDEHAIDCIYELKFNL